MTTENLKNPSVPTLTNPVGIDEPIQRAQILMGGLSWLQKSFGRAKTHPSTVNDKTNRPEPKVYQGGGEYYPVVANDALSSYSFFRVPSFRQFDDYAPNTVHIPQRTKVDWICWGNLKAIDSSRDDLFTEELLDEALNLINTNPDVVMQKVWDDKPEDIFKGYALEPNHRDLLMHPYFAFRFEFDLCYYTKCQ